MLNFRYDLKPKPRVHAFEPKGLGNDADLKALRATQLGAVFANNLHKVPSNKIASIVWEAGNLIGCCAWPFKVRIDEGAPATIQALKPKYTLTCGLALGGKKACQLA